MMAPRPAAVVPVAVVVSAHGFGHAARACAVMAALAQRRPELRFEIVTTVPRWFFEQSLAAPFSVHRLVTDVGLVQRTPLEEDLDATADRLNRLLAPRSGRLERLAGRIAKLGCRIVLADIAPLGIAAARRLGIPSVLVENFGWDWIYRGYADAVPRLARHAEALAALSATADLHLQTEPACRPVASAVAVPPVARQRRTAPAELRRALGIAPDARLVVLTMGGVGWSYRGLAAAERHRRAWFAVPGGAPQPRWRGRVLLLPFHSEIYHPDLVQAADVVVGKLGYSTVAEVYQARAAMAFVSRPGFRESAVLAEFVRRTAPSVEITEAVFNDGSWLDAVDGLLDAERPTEARINGAAAAAAAILDRFGEILR
jgi:hypothetical protein